MKDQRWGLACRAAAATARRAALSQAPPHGSAEESALAKVGISALIDEATGYQEKRAPDALRKMMPGNAAKTTTLVQAKRRIGELLEEVARLKKALAKANAAPAVTMRLDVVGVSRASGRGKATVEETVPGCNPQFCNVLAHGH